MPYLSRGLPASLLRREEAFLLLGMQRTSCGYSIGRNMAEQTYYKGTAASEEKEKGAKKWTKYDF